MTLVRSGWFLMGLVWRETRWHAVRPPAPLQLPMLRLPCPSVFYLNMLPGNIQSRSKILSHSLSGVITLPLYDEAQVALRSRGIEKKQVAQSWGTFRNVSIGNSIGISDSWFTIYLIYTTQPSWAQCTGKKPSIRECGLHSAGHSSTEKLWLSVK